MEGIKYVNLIEIGTVVIEIRGVENGKLAVSVNNTLVRHTAFLANDTRPCVLIVSYIFFICFFVIPICSFKSVIFSLSSRINLFIVIQN